MKKIIPFLFLTGLAAQLYAQSIHTETFPLHSAILKESRSIQVYVPKQSNSIKQSYPVIYVFDAASLFWSTVSASRFMNYSSSLPQMPESIVVGIINTNRDRDMPVPQEFASTDGAKNFLQFLSGELAPYINQHYPANGLNILIGHSQGGLFVTYAGLELPALFPFILAMDAPVTVNQNLLLEYQQRISAGCNLNYFSAETQYGWGNTLHPPAGCNRFAQKRIEDETHETMPHTGIYEGLKFLFREHLPPEKDLSLESLQDYYKNLSGKYHCKYAPPASVILTAARQNINSSRKAAALALLQFYEKNYGKSQQSANLLAKAIAINKGPDERVAFYLHHPGVTDESLKPYMGKWKGTLFVPGGTDMSISWEIKKINDTYVLDARVLDEFNTKSDFLLVTGEQELAWGRKHNGGGIYLSLGKLSADGRELTGKEEMIGVTIPDGVPYPKPNTFRYLKISD